MLRSPSPSEAAPKSGASEPFISCDELGGVGEIGIGMAAAEIRQRGSPNHGAFGRAEAALENLDGVGTGHRVHRVVPHAKGRSAQEAAHAVEVEQRLHQRRIVGHGSTTSTAISPSMNRPRLAGSEGREHRACDTR